MSFEGWITNGTLLSSTIMIKNTIKYHDEIMVSQFFLAGKSSFEMVL